jgi:hypothetical protein
METCKDISGEVALFTGGMIGNHEWWVVKGVDGGFNSPTKPSHEKDIIDHFVLENHFITRKGELIGDINAAEWYLKNNLVVDNEYPNMVAIVAIKPVHQLYPMGLQGLGLDQHFIKAYYGYSHRGGQSFKLGDMLFDENWLPSDEQMDTPEMKSAIARFEETNEGLNASNHSDKDKAVESIPFTKRGSVVIETWQQARQAAINLAKYLS